MNFNPNLNDYYVTLLTIIVTLNSVSIPLSYNIISDNLRPFFDKRLAEYFLEERDFRDNIIVSVWSLPILGLPLLLDFTTFLDVGNNKSITEFCLNLYNIFVFVFMAVFVGSFIRFSKLVYQYASNTEEIVFSKIKPEIDEFWKTNNERGSTEDFYANINKLYKLIQVSLEKEQTRNAEKYINYFFEVMVKFYKKKSRVQKSEQTFDFTEFISSETNIDIIDVKRSEFRFPNRKIETVFGDFFISRSLGIITANIKTSRFDVFYFCLSKFKDSIRILLKSPETYESASLLLNQFKFIADKIYAYQNQLS